MVLYFWGAGRWRQEKSWELSGQEVCSTEWQNKQPPPMQEVRIGTDVGTHGTHILTLKLEHAHTHTHTCMHEI